MIGLRARLTRFPAVVLPYRQGAMPRCGGSRAGLRRLAGAVQARVFALVEIAAGQDTLGRIRVWSGSFSAVEGIVE
ncbi:protein of unknown function [Azospirillum baldaniorum]|uniref:Uncharacterized protein n=1 Tax=Azospirillum baldaniorum TaxID=1064539 RepID=A0A9P1NKK4_9PROT|nr:protein of unknown function [Azospirillum baldaniorum]